MGIITYPKSERFDSIPWLSFLNRINDGTDGSLLVSSNLTKVSDIYRHRNITVNNGQTLSPSGEWIVLLSKEDVIINGTITASGKGKSGGSGGKAGNPVTPPSIGGNGVGNVGTGGGGGGGGSGQYESINRGGEASVGGGSHSLLGGTAGSGGASHSGSGGSAGTSGGAGQNALNFDRLDYTSFESLTSFVGAGGGGGGGAGYGGSSIVIGASGGAGGGGIIIVTDQSITGTGAIRADGMKGEDGTSGTSNGGAGGGGGGGGGFILLVAKSIQVPVITASGGAGGIGGTGYKNGGSGGAGGNGMVWKLI